MSKECPICGFKCLGLNVDKNGCDNCKEESISEEEQEFFKNEMIEFNKLLNKRG